MAGLLTPAYLACCPAAPREELKNMSHQQRAVYVMKLFLDEFSVKEPTDFANASTARSSLTRRRPRCGPWTAIPTVWSCGTAPPAPSRTWPFRCCPSAHRLLRKQGGGKRRCASWWLPPATPKRRPWEGFRDVDHTKILVFYPKDGVSTIQELQMVTQEGAMWGPLVVVT